MPKRWFAIIAVLTAALAVSGCTLASSNITPEPLESPTPIVTGKPQVTIGSPETGDEVNLGDDVLVSAIATDDAGVTSVQLFANDTLVKTISSQEAAGDRNLPVVLDYEPRGAGNVLLEVIAYRGTVASDPATVSINVLEEEEEVQQPVDPGNEGPVINPNDPTCRILTNVALNYRTGPGTVYNRLGTFSAGQQVPIVGRVGDNSWWQVQLNNFSRVWVSSDFTTEYGNCFNIPVVSIPPTPTSDADPTATNTPTRTPTPTPTPTPSDTPVPGAADLVVADISGPEELTLDGGSVTGNYSVTITNTGESNTGQFASTIRYLPGGDTIELALVSNLGDGESILLNGQLIFEEAGEFTIQVMADSEDDVDEVSSVNNVGTFVVEVVAEAE